MKIELDIEATVQAAITAALSPDVLQDKVTKLVSDAVDTVLTNQFRAYGEFGKVVEKAIKTVVPHEVSIDGAARFDHTLKVAIERRLAAYGDERMCAIMKPMLDGILEVPPAEITLSKLVTDAVEAWADHHRRDNDSQPTVIVEETSYGSRFIYMDPRADKRKYDCAVRFGVSDSDGRMFGLKVEGSEVGKALFAGDYYCFERDLFALFTRGSKMVIDRDDFSDVHYPDSED